MSYCNAKTTIKHFCFLERSLFLCYDLKNLGGNELSSILSINPPHPPRGRKVLGSVREIEKTTHPVYAEYMLPKFSESESPGGSVEPCSCSYHEVQGSRKHLPSRSCGAERRLIAAPVWHSICPLFWGATSKLRRKLSRELKLHKLHWFRLSYVVFIYIRKFFNLIIFLSYILTQVKNLPLQCSGSEFLQKFNFIALNFLLACTKLPHTSSWNVQISGPRVDEKLLSIQSRLTQPLHVWSRTHDTLKESAWFFFLSRKIG